MITACGRWSACTCVGEGARGRPAAPPSSVVLPRRRDRSTGRRAACASTSRCARTRRSRSEVVAAGARACERDLLEQRAADDARARSPRSRASAATDRSRRARRAARACVCRASMTTEMLRSDEPCAIARTLTPAPAERAEDVARRRRACRPCRRRRRRRMLQPGATSTSWIWPSLQLGAERALAPPARARSALRLGHREADRVLGAALRDHHDRDAVARAARRTGAARCRARRSCRCPRR